MALLSQAARRWFVARDPRALARRWVYRPVLLRLEDRTLPSFITAPQYPAGAVPYAVAVGDFNGDGQADLVVANATAVGTLSVLRGNGSGQFRRPVSYPVGNSPSSVAVGDLDGDQDLDLVVTNTGSNTVSVLKNQGNGTFAAATSYAVGVSPWSVAVGDLDGDQDLDLVVANFSSGTASVLRNQG